MNELLCKKHDLTTQELRKQNSEISNLRHSLRIANYEIFNHLQAIQGLELSSQNLESLKFHSLERIANGSFDYLQTKFKN